MYTYTRIHAYTYICIHIHTHTHTYTHGYIYIHLRTYMYIYIYTYTYAYAHIYIYMSTSIAYAHPVEFIGRQGQACSKFVRWCSQHLSNIHTCTCTVRNNTCKCMLTFCKKMYMDSCIRAYSTVQHLLCHGDYYELILSLAQTSCSLLFTARPTARPLPGNPLPDVVRSRNSFKSTPAHDAVATAVLHKHHLIIHVGTGLIQFVYRSHLRWSRRLPVTEMYFRHFSHEFFHIYIHIWWDAYS